MQPVRETILSRPNGVHLETPGFLHPVLAKTGVFKEDNSMKMLADIAKDALELAPQQRLQLARILLDLSEPNLPFCPDADNAWENEIARRMESVKAGTAQSRSFDRVFSDLDRQFPS